MPSVPKGKCILGLDPGEKGGLALVDVSTGELVDSWKMPATANELNDMVRHLFYRSTGFAIHRAYLEKIDPRPTRYFSRKEQKWVSTVLPSTCILYGDYVQLHMCCIANGLEVEIVRPQDWQKGLEIPVRDKKAKETQPMFKRRLKQVALDMFPDKRITLYTCDAILIAEYGRRLENA